MDICEKGETSDKMLVPGRGQRGKIERVHAKEQKNIFAPLKDHTSAIILWEIMYLLGIVFYNGTHHFEHSDLGSACNS